MKELTTPSQVIHGSIATGVGHNAFLALHTIGNDMETAGNEAGNVVMHRAKLQMQNSQNKLKTKMVERGMMKQHTWNMPA